jgi:hypothetical protein
VPADRNAVAMMIPRYLSAADSDDGVFLALVRSLVSGVLDSGRSKHVFVIKIDSWFGKRWLGFSGKSCGKLGIRKTRLTLPPFVPSRVVSQFEWTRPGAPAQRSQHLHIWQPGGANLGRYLESVVPDSSIIWFSGQSAESDRASVMAYVAAPDGHWAWYLGFQRTRTWRIVERAGISAEGVRELLGESLRVEPG